MTLPSEKKPIDYLLAEDRATLVWLANLAAIELHMPLARAEAPERPTALVFDLDPGAPATVIECCRVALTLHGMFENLGLRELRQDVRQKGAAAVPAAERSATSPSSRPSRLPKPSPSCSSRAEPELVVSRMTKAAARGQGADRLEPERPQQDDRLRLLAARRPSARPSRRRCEWEEVRAALDGGDPDALRFEAGQVLERVAERGDLFAPVLSLAQKLPSV